MATKLSENENELACLFIKVTKEIISEKAVQERCPSIKIIEEIAADDRKTSAGLSFSTPVGFYSALLEPDKEHHSERSIFLNSPYPKYPLYEGIALKLFEWVKTYRCPFLFKREIALLNEEASKERRETLNEVCKELLQNIRDIAAEICDRLVVNDYIGVCQDDMYMEGNSFVKFKCYISDLLAVLGERGIMYVLGLRETVGSIIKAPPPPSKLMETFTRPQNDKSKLTVGARALSKHFHRCRSEWWGGCKGTEAQKNEHALNVLQKVVHDGVWINLHMLPHDCEVIEIRCSDGYGARWTSDGNKFRGFLEPQMEDGHAVHWRH